MAWAAVSTFSSIETSAPAMKLSGLPDAITMARTSDARSSSAKS